MPKNSSPQEVLLELENDMGTPLGKIFHQLSCDCSFLHLSWSEFQNIYFNENNFNILNSAASAFFFLHKQSLIRDILMTLRRVSDPDKTGKNENLSLKQLLNHLDDELKEETTSLIDKFCWECEPIKKWCNKNVAHKDLPECLGQEKLDIPEKTNISESIKAFQNTLNCVERFYRKNGARTRYDLLKKQPSKQLIFCLKTYLESKDLRKKNRYK